MPARGQGKKYGGMNWIRPSTRWAIYVRDMDTHTTKLVCSWCLREVFPWSGGKGKKKRRICLDHLTPVNGLATRSNNLAPSGNPFTPLCLALTLNSPISLSFLITKLSHAN
jgi:hypothetical protein